MPENIKRVLEPYGGEWKEKKGVWAWSYRFDYQVMPVR
jgi:hypothetical protein